MKYRKKPIEVNAFQLKDWSPDEMYSKMPSWIRDDRIKIHYLSGSITYIEINTLEGKMKALPGDYIIQGVKGEIYPCKLEIFLDTYEEVK